MPDTQHAQNALGSADVAGPQPVDITQPVCQQNVFKISSDLDFIMGFEDGSIFEHDDIVAGFQQLINSGLVWKLQGVYGRTAQALIDLGECHLPTARD